MIFFSIQKHPGHTLPWRSESPVVPTLSLGSRGAYRMWRFRFPCLTEKPYYLKPFPTEKLQARNVPLPPIDFIQHCLRSYRTMLPPTMRSVCAKKNSPVLIQLWTNRQQVLVIFIMVVRAIACQVGVITHFLSDLRCSRPQFCWIITLTRHKYVFCVFPATGRSELPS